MIPRIPIISTRNISKKDPKEKIINDSSSIKINLVKIILNP